jgi:hypothetical protein
MYKVWIGNVPIECDTAEAALALATKADGAAVPTTKNAHGSSFDVHNSGGESRWTTKRAKEFFVLIDGNQKKLIDTLLANADGQTDEQLRRHLSLGSGRALGGVMAGASKNAKKVGADPDDLFEKKHVVINGEHAREYFLSESFRKAASQVQQ